MITFSGAAVRHAFALTLFAGLSVLWTFPLVANLTTHIPGPSAGDNVTFLWNFWWMRTAIEQRTDFLVTPFICAPWGVNLTLHTHTALPAFIGATLGRGLSIVAALNLLLLAGIALNGACAYWLAWRTTRDHAAATVAGCVFGCCPFLAGHLQGHFNLVHAWTIPLFATAAIESLGGNRARWALFAGFIAGLTAYVDYYFVVYEFVLFALLMIWQTRDWTTDRVDGPRRFRAASRAAGALALVFLAVIVTIRITGGQTFRVLGQRVSLHGTFNALQLFWICVVAALLFSTSIRLRLVPRVVDPVSALVQPLLLVVLAFCVTASPILWHAASMALHGDYVTQSVFWRSSPSGVDVAALLLPNPFHPVWGHVVAGFLQQRGVSVDESVAWLGVVPFLLACAAVRSWRISSSTRLWIGIGAVFFVWALGPHLMVLGRNTGFILPHAILRYVPILSNARMPGRAFVVVYLAIAVLAAIAVNGWKSRPGGRVTLVSFALLFVLLDYLPAPFPLTRLETPSTYMDLRNRPEAGALLELPLGLRDGFGVRGFMDERVLWYQSTHGRPLAGGFVARLPPSTIAAYTRDPLLSALLDLSQNEETTAPPDRASALEILHRQGIAFVMVDRRTAPTALLQYVDSVLPLTRVATSGERTLFQVLRE